MSRETRAERKRRMARDRQRKHRAKKKELRREDEEKLDGFEVSSNRPLDIDEGVDWINSKLVIPTGPAAGTRFKLMPWQEDWIRASYAPGIRTSGLSVARKNAKTMVNDALALCHLVGPWARANWRGLVCADKLDNASIFLDQLVELARASDLHARIDVKRSRPPVVRGAGLSQLTILAAEKHGSGHASNADIVWVDECGALRENHRQLYRALFSSIGARNGRMFCIGNQREGPMFRELAMRADEPSVHWVRYTAPADCDIYDNEAWLSSNPGLGVIKSYEYMKDAADAARGAPADLAYFRSHELNQDIDPERIVIVRPEQWFAIEADDAEIRDEPVVLGLDLGGSTSMSAVVAVGLESGIMMAWAGWGDHLTLLERGRRDGVDNLYMMMREREELQVYPGEIIAAGQFIWDVLENLRERGARIVALGTDRYRRYETTKALRESGYRGPVHWRGIGASSTADGSADIRSFQKVVIRREMRARSSLLMANAIRSSTLREDRAGNPALEKGSNRNSRIDALQAAVIAAGLFERERERAHGVWLVGG